MNRKNKYSKSQPADEHPERTMQQHAPAAAEIWPDISRVWEQVGSPLRPSAQDISFFNSTINSWANEKRTPRALILGVTPELYNLPWPDGTDLLAVDRTQGMINNVWPGPRNAAICDDWTTMPLQSGSRDIVLCDGGVHLLTYPHEHRKFVQTLHRVIAPDGLCIFRLFIPPEKREEPEKVLQDLLDAKISNLNLLKLRLDMALHKDITQGVQLGLVWDAIHQAAPDFNRLASRLGWSLEHLLVINTYRDCQTRYHFLNLDDVRHLFCENPGGFRLEAVNVPTYELGERCPTVVFRRTDIKP
jgi:SAM-dependent methyltransferase